MRQVWMAAPGIVTSSTRRLFHISPRCYLASPRPLIRGIRNGLPTPSGVLPRPSIRPRRASKSSQLSRLRGRHNFAMRQLGTRFVPSLAVLALITFIPSSALVAQGRGGGGAQGGAGGGAQGGAFGQGGGGR